MAKRHLSDEEKKVTLKSISRLKDEIEYTEYQKEFCELKINKGLELEYKKQLKDYRNALKEYENEIKLSKQKLSILNEQLRNGVEIKNVKGGEDNGK
jgi:hypothetical protein